MEERNGETRLPLLVRLAGGEPVSPRQILLFWATTLVLAVLLVPRLPWSVINLYPGDISSIDYRATHGLLVEDASQEPPAQVPVKKGEMIAREGDPLTSLQILKIRALAQAEARDTRMLSLLGMVLLAALSLFAFYRVFAHMEPRMAGDLTRLALLAAVLAGQALLTRLALLTAGAVSARYGIPETALALAVPYALAPMLAAPLFSTSVGILVAGASAFYSAAAHDWSLTTFIFTFVGGAVASFRVVRCQQRSALVRAGLAVGAANLVTAAVLALLAGGLAPAAWAYHLASALAGGIGASLVASLALPVLESASRISSDMRLMELTNLNQPLLRQMIMVAPGTYHHSVMVGTMAEAAAEEIGANPVLSRVAAFYHDIGKAGKPEYFVENQQGRPSRHDKLTPNMSALILMSHVKDGMELVRSHHLPEEVARIIGEHHGTRLISFFYNRAKEQEEPAVQTVDELDFRYPGPKPQTREAALIMLADQTEAAAKVLADPTPARVQGTVQKIIKDIFADGQLDECDLTLRDLHLIAKSFTRSLIGMYHQRVDYPEKPGGPDDRKDKARRKPKDTDDDRTPERKDPQGPSGAGGPADLKRLGQG
jgi:putative nucleotidyltransferase with HDIG domain